uniref:Uncharacterized protein n=1 Tax=Anguilla anguilla TaxID=7936 RepID=A0A0E9RAD7_ANGAN
MYFQLSKILLSCTACTAFLLLLLFVRTHCY